MRILILLLATLTASATIIQPSRRITWDPGIPGGIPFRTTINTTLNAIDNTGATDVRASIQSALDACPSNQVVKLPAGTFKIVGKLSIPTGVTLRGVGTNTVLDARGVTTSGLIEMGTSGLPFDPTGISTTISSGASRDSTSLVVASATGISVGTYLVITETNDASFVTITGGEGPAGWVDGWNDSGARARGQIVEVTGVSGTTITFTPGLYADYTRVPWATRFAATCKWAGVEDLKIAANNTGTDRNILMQTAAYCWAYNVEGDYTDGDHVSVEWGYRCEINHCYFHDAYLHTAGSFDTQVGLKYKSSACLVVNNIIRRLHVAVLVEWGAAGNVIAYNYDAGNFDENINSAARWLPPGLLANHGAHPQFNLFEGNVGQKFAADFVWGSSSHGTIFRNYFSGFGIAHPPISGARASEDLGTTYELIQANRAVDLTDSQTTYNVVGNVLGNTRNWASRSPVRLISNPSTRSYDTIPYALSLGYRSEADTSSTASIHPSTTLLDHGNYDTVTAGIVWDGAIADHVLPDSLYLASKPSWFGSLTYPPIDPASPNTNYTIIPAGYRFANGTDPIGSPGTVASFGSRGDVRFRGDVRPR